jgi:hypothetical protein
LEGKPIGPDPKKKLKGEKILKVSSWFFFFFCLFIILFFYPCCSNSMRMEDKLFIEGIVDNTPTMCFPIIFINSRVNMVDCVDPHKVTNRKRAFLVFPSAKNGSENRN